MRRKKRRMSFETKGTIIILAIAVCFLSLQGLEAAEVKRLTFWDQFTPSQQSEGVNLLIDRFEALNPDVKIKRIVMTGENLKTVLKTALASGAGPDIQYYDTGPDDLGLLAKAGLVYDLTEAHKTYGWNDRFFKWTRDACTFGGRIWGISSELEFIGVFYNKDIFKKIGVTEPNTYEEFVTICEKAKQAGYIPVAFGNRARWPASHIRDMFLNNLVPREELLKIFSGKGSWIRPDVIEALTLFQEMAKKGFFPPGVNSISYDDANMLYYSAQAAMVMTGSWLISNIEANTDFETGFFFLPQIKPNVPVRSPAGVGSTYQVSSKTEYPDAALKFLDYLMSPDAAPIWLEKVAVIPPFRYDISKLDIPDTLRFACDILYNRFDELGTALYMVYTASFDEMERSEHQALIAGQITPEELAKKFEAVWQEDIKAGKIW